jgi:hypothetical protein
LGLDGIASIDGAMLRARGDGRATGKRGLRIDKGLAEKIFLDSYKLSCAPYAAGAQRGFSKGGAREGAGSLG